MAKDLRGSLEEFRAAMLDRTGVQDQCGDLAKVMGVIRRTMDGTDDPPVAGLRIDMPVAERLFDPEEDDPEDYGRPWLLVEEWRGLWTGHPHDGKILS